MPKKTLYFDRSNMRNKTSINPKKGQHISGQDILFPKAILIMLFRLWKACGGLKIMRDLFPEINPNIVGFH